MTRFCSQCGTSLLKKIPRGDDRERQTCPACGHIHYDNPRLVAGCLITHKGKVQLVRRAIDPERGRWTLPAGYMETGETVEQAAVREAWEEARARVISQGLYMVYCLPQFNEVYMIIRGELTGFHVGDAGFESSNVGLFEETEIPWDELAFSALVTPALQTLYADRRKGCYPVRSVELSGLAKYEN